MKTPGKPSEAVLHGQIAGLLAVVLDDSIFWSSIEVSNQQGGKAGYIKQAKLKAKGVKAGVPDIIIVYNGCTLWLEVKRHNGVVSKVQKAIHKLLRQNKQNVEVVRSLEDVQLSLLKHGIPAKNMII